MNRIYHRDSQKQQKIKEEYHFPQVKFLSAVLEFIKSKHHNP